MYALNFVYREVEGTWKNLICVSESKEKLENRALIEQAKFMSENEDTEQDFNMGMLEQLINKKINEIKSTFSEETGMYTYGDIQIKTFLEIREIAKKYGMEFAKSLNLTEEDVDSIVFDRFYESRSYVISEIEVI